MDDLKKYLKIDKKKEYSIDFSEKYKVIIDVGSIYQFIPIYSLINTKFSNRQFFLFWRGRNDQLSLSKEIFGKPQKIFKIVKDTEQKSISNKNFLFSFNLKKKFKQIRKIYFNDKKDVIIFTSFPHGFYFEFIKKVFKVKNCNVIIFDDGSINNFVVKNKYRFIYFLALISMGIFKYPPKYRLFSDSRFKNIFTSINPENIYNKSKKNIYDISIQVSNLIQNISDNKIIISKSSSALLLSTPAVEAGRMTISNYRKLITNVYLKLKDLGVNEIYLSKHPGEGTINNSFYKTLGLNFIYEKYPAELIISNKKISFIANPLNSTIINLAKTRLLGNHIISVISYLPNKRLYADRIFKMIDKILKEKNINHHYINEL